MKSQRHKRKEAYSILIISNLDRNNRQFRMTHSTFRLLICLLLLIGIAGGVFIYWSASGIRQLNGLQKQLLEQEQLVKQLDEENEKLNKENQKLETELASLQPQPEPEEAVIEATAAEPPEKLEVVSTLPSRYPSSGSGVLTSTFSEEQPYITITVNADSDILAAGNGTVSAISSDGTYPYIIELEHADHYKTRYLYRWDAELKVAEGDQVSSGDTLLTITSDNTALDYQVLHEDAPVDPLSVIEAKG